MYVYKSIRLWYHDKGHFTRNHYDANGTDLFNICVNGSKQFSLAPPDTFINYPYSGVSINSDPSDVYYDKVIIKSGDLLFIPSFWYHKVLTLEDNSRNFNFTMHYLYQSPSLRNKQLMIAHRMFNTIMYNNNKGIQLIYQNKPINLYTVYILLLESLPILCLMMGFMLLTRNILKFMHFIVGFVILLIIPHIHFVRRETYGLCDIIVPISIVLYVFLYVFVQVFVYILKSYSKKNMNVKNRNKYDK